jgi:hypothetical protein
VTVICSDTNHVALIGDDVDQLKLFKEAAARNEVIRGGAIAFFAKPLGARQRATRNLQCAMCNA